MRARVRSTARNAVSIRSECVCVHATHGRSVDAHTRSVYYRRRLLTRALGRKLNQVRCVCLWFTKYVNKRCDV